MSEITVKASAKGYFGGPRNPGDVFQVPAGSKATWFKEVADVKPTNVKKHTGPISLRQTGEDLV